MKKNKLILLFISFFIFLIFPLNAHAYGYKIDKYKVDIIVNENNVLNVTETIDANFEVEKHGIFRKIPTKNKIQRNDFTTKNRAKIRNVSITGDQYTQSVENGVYTFKIGDPYRTLTGPKQYVIKYDYDFGDDNIDEYDELYFNIIGTEWDCNMENVEFSIKMPKDFDQTKINFPMGYYGATYYEDVEYQINDNLITGTIKKDRVTGNALNQYEGLTVRIELPEGYFKGERKVIDPTYIIIMILSASSILFILISSILYVKYGKKDKFILVPEYTVPDDLTPAEIGY